jgi:outer membrane protein TolC
MTMMQYAKLVYISGMNLSSVQAPDSLAMPVLSYTVDSLMIIAERSRPLVLGIRAALARSNVAAERSDLESYPDFDVMLMYMQRDALNTPTGPMQQMDMLTAQLSVKLPLGYGGKNSAARAEAEAMQRMTLSEEEMALRDIRMGLTEKLAKLEELRTKHDLLKNLALPSLRMISESFAADYSYDKTSLQSVIGEELSLLHKQHDLFEMESEAYKTIAEIEYIIGADIIPITR